MFASASTLMTLPPTMNWPPPSIVAVTLPSAPGQGADRDRPAIRLQLQGVGDIDQVVDRDGAVRVRLDSEIVQGTGQVEHDGRVRIDQRGYREARYPQQGVMSGSVLRHVISPVKIAFPSRNRNVNAWSTLKSDQPRVARDFYGQPTLSRCCTLLPLQVVKVVSYSLQSWSRPSRGWRLFDIRIRQYDQIFGNKQGLPAEPGIGS